MTSLFFWAFDRRFACSARSVDIGTGLSDLYLFRYHLGMLLISSSVYQRWELRALPFDSSLILAGGVFWLIAHLLHRWTHSFRNLNPWTRLLTFLDRAFEWGSFHAVLVIRCKSERALPLDISRTSVFFRAYNGSDSASVWRRLIAVNKGLSHRLWTTVSTILWGLGLGSASSFLSLYGWRFLFTCFSLLADGSWVLNRSTSLWWIWLLRWLLTSWCGVATSPETTAPTGHFLNRDLIAIFIETIASIYPG